MGTVTMGSPGYVIMVAFLLLSFMATSTAAGISDTSSAILIRVDQSGNGGYKRIQDAIDAVPSGNSNLIFILINPGVYREKIVIPADKPFITLSGSKASTTIITWNDGGDTFGSATVSVLGSYFVGRFLTIKNTYGPGAQAVALRVSGDKAAFYGCSITAYQDTLLDDSGMHYYINCYIEGATDFICGNGLSLFEKCHLHSITDGGGAITAQRRSSATENTGYSFVGCKITGVADALLGRPWGPYSRVIFAQTYMANMILPQGWDYWNDSNNQRTAFYGQYECSGPGSNVSQRVPWSHDLSSEEAAPFLTKSMINGQDWIRPPPKKFRRGSSTIVGSADGN